MIDDRQPARQLHSSPTVARTARRVLRAFFRGVRRVLVRQTRPRGVCQSRRALLRGQFWKLHRSAPPDSTPIRYPQTRSDLAGPTGRVAKPERQAIAGISIEPVAATDLSTSRVSRPIPLFRPPGAVEEAHFLRECTRCSDCIAACPHDAIRKASDRYGSAAGTPVIEADQAACLMCEDFPCIAACEPGVLRSENSKAIGVARVTSQLCLAYNGTLCTVCSERCPVAGAIGLSENKPTIVEDVCTGCGVCRYVCPAPENAILLMPTLVRPTSVHP